MRLHEFRDRYARFCGEISSDARKRNLRSMGKEIGFGYWNPLSGPGAHVCGFSFADASNHEKIARQAFIDKLKGDAAALRADLCAALPALDVPRAEMRFGVMRSGQKEPKIAIQICGMRIGGRDGQLFSTVMEKLETACGRIAMLPRPAGRLFEIDGKTIPAFDPGAAYRVWAAFDRPDFFDPSANSKAQGMDIHETIDGQAAHEALVA